MSTHFLNLRFYLSLVCSIFCWHFIAIYRPHKLSTVQLCTILPGRRNDNEAVFSGCGDNPTTKNHVIRHNPKKTCAPKYPNQDEHAGVWIMLQSRGLECSAINENAQETKLHPRSIHYILAYLGYTCQNFIFVFSSFSLIRSKHVIRSPRDFLPNIDHSINMHKRERKHRRK